MCGHPQEEQMKTLEETRKASMLHTEQTAIKEQLVRLETWTTTPGQTQAEARQAFRESLIRSQQEQNAAMQAAVQSQMPPAQATAAAAGQPLQEQAPAKLTYKQRREQARKEKEAKKHCPVGTALTYDCQHSLADLQQSRENSLSSVPHDGSVDVRVLRSFCQGFRTNKKGQPANEEEREKKEQDCAFLEAYISKDLERRKPYLDKMCKELIEYPLRADTVSDAFLLGNVQEAKIITDRFCYIENVMNDPINKPYFDAMPPEEYALLDQKSREFAALGAYFVNLLGGIGVNTNSAVYYEHGGEDSINAFKQLADMQKESVQQMAAGWREKEKEILRPHMEQAAKQQRDQISRELHANGGEEGAALMGYASEELKKFRDQLSKNPEQYAVHKPALDRLYQQIYQRLAVLSEVTLDLHSCQYLVDEYQGSERYSERRMMYMADEKRDVLSEEAKALRLQIAGLGDCMKLFLTDTPLQEKAREALKQMGLYDKEIAFRDGQLAVRKAFLGDGGAVAQSNQAYREAQNGENSAEAARSTALQRIGIRSSSSDSAKADKVLRGETYTKLPQEIADYFHTQEAANTDFEQIANSMEKKQLGVSAYVSGGGVDAVNADLLKMYERYLNSQDSLRYLREMCSTLKGAEVFHGKEQEILAFLSQSLLNSYGANFSVVAGSQDSYANGAAIRKVAMESCRTLLSLPAMMRLPQEERENLPETTRALLSAYETLLQQVLEKLTPAAV